MRITNNVANLSGGSGISLEGGAFDSLGVAHGGALIADNTANQNSEDGISVAEPARHTLAGNSAYNNSGYGIQAGEEPNPGEPADPNANIDGGGNRASGNHSDGVTPGLPGLVQCLGVVCDESGSVPMAGIDLTAPTTTILDGPLGPPPPPVAGTTGAETAVFTFTGNDGPTGTPATAMTFECRVDAPPDPVEPVEPELEPPDPNDPEIIEPPEGETWVECVSPLTVIGLEPGEHHFEVRAVDANDNFDLTPAEYVWTVHAGVDDVGQNESPPVPPETRITSAPGELITDEAGTRYDTTNRAATFRFAGSDNLTAGYNLTYECRRYHEEFNDALTPADMPAEAVLPFASCESPELYTGLDYGGHIFEVRAVDLAGNKDTQPAWHSWWIHPPPPDITPPDTTISSGPDPVTVLTSATFDFGGSDNQTPVEELAFQCRLDGAMLARPAALDELHVAARRHREQPGDPDRARAPGPGGRPGRQRRRRERDDVGLAPGRRAGRLCLEGRPGAGAEDRLLRPEDHAEHHRQQQPRRLPRPRPHRRRGLHHDRPEREDDRRQVDRRRDPEQRLRLRHDQERPADGLRLRRQADPRHEAEHRRGGHGAAEPGRRREPRLPHRARGPDAAASPSRRPASSPESTTTSCGRTRSSPTTAASGSRTAPRTTSSPGT